ncbi:MAG: YbjN domain-containing protein [Firmicutes bacterium]|nr:YbjN domain-containing protein [Bacillota bacterium]
MADALAILNILRDKIAGYLTEGLGNFEQDSEGDFLIEYETARIMVCPRTWSEGKTIVKVFSITNLDVPESPALFEFIAKENFRLLIGHFSYDEDNLAVWLEHVLLGEEINKESLMTVITTIAILADRFDNVIKQKFGGILYTEA